MIKDLVNLANHLDNIGEIKLASQLDAIIRSANSLNKLGGTSDTTYIKSYPNLSKYMDDLPASYIPSTRVPGKLVISEGFMQDIGVDRDKLKKAFQEKSLSPQESAGILSELERIGSFGNAEAEAFYKELLHISTQPKSAVSTAPVSPVTTKALTTSPATTVPEDRFGYSELGPSDYGATSEYSDFDFESAYRQTSPSPYPSSTPGETEAPSATAPAATGGPVPDRMKATTQTGRGTTQTGRGTVPSYVYPVEKDPNGPVHEMQRALGFTPDLVDGKFGRKTLEKYQAATGQRPVSGDPAKSLEILRASLTAKAPVVAPTVAPTATETAVVPSQTAKSLEDVMMEIRPAKIYPQNYFIRRYPGLKNIELINNPNGPMIGSEALKRVRQLVGVKAASDNAEERINKMASEYESAIFSGDNAFFRRR
jgi:hypothetical protein